MASSSEGDKAVENINDQLWYQAMLTVRLSGKVDNAGRLSLAESGRLSNIDCIYKTKMGDIAVKTANGEMVRYNSNAAASAFASLQYYASGNFPDKIEILTVGIGELAVRLQVLSNELALDDKAALAYALLMRAEIIPESARALIAIENEYRRTYVTLPSMTDNSDKVKERIQPEAATFLLQDAITRGANPMLVVAETIGFFMTLSDGGADWAKLPIMSYPESDKFMENIRRRRDAAEACRVTGSTKLKLGWSIAEMKPEAELEGIRGAWFRFRWEEKLHRMVKSYFAKEETRLKKSMFADSNMRFTISGMMSNTMGCTIYCEEEKMLIRISLTMRGEHIMLYASNVIDDSYTNFKNIYENLQGEIQDGKANCTEYVMVDGEFHRRLTTGGLDIIKINGYEMTRQFGKLLREYNVPTYSWFATCGRKLREEANGDAVVIKVDDLLLANTINSLGTSSTTLMTFGHIKHDDGTVLRLAYCNQNKGRKQLPIKKSDGNRYYMMTRKDARNMWERTTIVA